MQNYISPTGPQFDDREIVAHHCMLAPQTQEIRRFMEGANAFVREITKIQYI